MTISITFPEIDEKQSIANAKHYLTHDFPRWLRASRTLTSIKSPIIDGMPRVHNVHSSEHRAISTANAQQVVAAVKDAIAGCDELSQNILTRLYLTTCPPTSTSLAIEIGYGYTQYNHLKNEALLQFALAFQDSKLLVLE